MVQTQYLCLKCLTNLNVLKLINVPKFPTWVFVLAVESLKYVVSIK